MKTINRNNYEDFFLLYLDNELDAEARLAVENFAEQNADLKAELQMLLQTKSLPGNLFFSDKELLLRTEGNSINEKNYEEYFLLYIDNELSAAKRAEVEMYVLQHPKLQDEFTTLKQAVLAPEVINYNDKESLYRTEKRKTFYIKPWRLAAAAIFTGVCALGGWLWQQSSSTIVVADNNNAQHQQQQNKSITKPADTIHKSIQPQQQVIAQQNDKKEIISNKQQPSIKKQKDADEFAIAKKKNKKQVDEDVASNKKEQANTQQPAIKHNNIAKQQKEPSSTVNEIAQVPGNIENKGIDVTSLQDSQNNEQNENGYNIYPVAYKEINTNDDDRSLHVGAFDLNKDRVKTLFKKAGRMFTNKKNNQE